VTAAPSETGSSGATLDLNQISYSYGSLSALREVTFSVPAGTACAVLGPNGAGKSTLASAIAGVLTTAPNSVVVDGVDVSSETRYRRARRGIAHVPESGGVFPGLTVAENLVVGNVASRRGRKQTLERAAAIFPFIGSRARQRAGMLSGGEQQMLSLSRILVHQPRLVVIDELSHGLAPAVLDQLFRVLADFRGRMTLVIVEQFVKRAHALADSVVVLSYGGVALSGPTSEVSLSAIEATYDLAVQNT
jgi:ABC-type branched-subunit amino acid transport system ATPase component